MTTTKTAPPAGGVTAFEHVVASTVRAVGWVTAFSVGALAVLLVVGVVIHAFPGGGVTSAVGAMVEVLAVVGLSLRRSVILNDERTHRVNAAGWEGEHAGARAVKAERALARSFAVRWAMLPSDRRVTIVALTVLGTGLLALVGVPGAPVIGYAAWWAALQRAARWAALQRAARAGRHLEAVAAVTVDRLEYANASDPSEPPPAEVH